MNGKAESLLEGYRKADFTKRLHLFLEYPELRTEFTQIERGASASGQRAVKQSDAPKTCRVRRWPRFLLLPGFQKRCCRQAILKGPW
jgi:hypothetical protein